VWQRYIPLDLRVAVDEARIKAERTRPREPYRARSEFSIVTPEIIAQHVPLAEFRPVIEAADAALALAQNAEASVPPSAERASGAYSVREMPISNGERCDDARSTLVCSRRAG
jgi:hypothetical protein